MASRPVREERRAQIAFAERREHDDDQLAGVFRTSGDLQAATVAAPEEMPTSNPSSRASRRARLIASSLPTVTTSSTRSMSSTGGNKAGADALDRVRAFLAAGQHRRRGRLHGDELDRGLALLEDLRDTGNGAAGADSGDEDVDLAVGVVPHFFGGGGAVDRRVGRVLELLRDEVALVGLGQFLGLGDRARHALGARGQDRVRRRRPAAAAPLDAHRLRHGQCQLVAAGRATIASAMPVLPLVGSRMIVSGLSRPASSAASIRATPRRSLTLAAGLKDSKLGDNVAPTPSVTRFSRTSGVLPTSSVMLSAIVTTSIPADVEVNCNVSG